MRKTLNLIAFAALSACSGADNGPTAPEIPAYSGAYCASNTPQVSRASDGSALVSLAINTTTYTDYRRSDGVVIRQEVRGCRFVSCSFKASDANGQTDSSLTSTCQSLTSSIR